MIHYRLQIACEDESGDYMPSVTVYDDFERIAIQAGPVRHDLGSACVQLVLLLSDARKLYGQQLELFN